MKMEGRINKSVIKKKLREICCVAFRDFHGDAFLCMAETNNEKNDSNHS